jgi:hypothetical protein
MLDPVLIVPIVGVLVAWVVVVFALRRWGPGRATRSVRCPEKGVRAKLRVEQREGDFGSLRVTDVLACSLLAAKPVDCDKECLVRL